MKVAIIPARGGSKRIHRKNIRDFAGKPIIGYSIECALNSGLFERVIVSTDDQEVAKLAREYGAEVPFVRPDRLSDDHTGTIEVIAHAIDWLNNRGIELSAVCCIYPAAPFLQDDDIRRGLNILENGNWEYVFSATRYPVTIFRAFQTNITGQLKMFYPEYSTTRSQDVTESLHDAAQFYWGRPKAWLSGVRIFSKTSTVILIPSWRVQDIDIEEDWLNAELMWQSLYKTDDEK